MLLKAIASLLSAVFSYISYTVLGDVLGYVLSRPKIIFLKNGWMAPNKGVSVSRDYSKYPTSDTFQEDYDKEVHSYYGITIQNQHFLLGPPKAVDRFPGYSQGAVCPSLRLPCLPAAYKDSSSSGSH